MEELKALVKVISKNKVKKIELIGDGSSSHSNYQKLYEKISDDTLLTDEEGEAHFFAGSKNKAYYFSRLKKQLNERLLNTLFFIDVNQPNFTEYQKAYYSCYKAATATKILLGKHARLPAVKLAEKTLKHAIKFELTDIILLLSKDLRFHYGGITGNRSKYDYYNNLVIQYAALFNAELLAEEYYTQIGINFINSAATKPEIIALSEKYSNELSQLAKKHDSYWFNLVCYNVFAARYEIANDYKNTIKVCEKALASFEQKAHIATNIAKFTFLIKILTAQIYLKHFDEIEGSIHKCLSLIPRGSMNWYFTYDFYMIYLFHSRQFNKAFEIFKKVTSDSSYKSQYKHISEHWIIYEAFIQYFNLIGKIDLTGEKLHQKFRISKFLNEVPTYSKDKRGTNITIIILQILFLLQQKKHGEIIDRMESLQTYTHRYLRQDDTFRSNCFIKMLLCLPAASFHKKAVLRKADKYWKKLQSVPLEEANQSTEMEIVPYEMLWEFVLEELDEKWYGV
ncbi:MAG: hypothetical protein R2828_08095 [Saprospiraceae bacterium]